jgi:toxin YoeB
MAQRNLLFTPSGWEDYIYWLDKDRKTIKKINRLIKDVQRDPLSGLGKPEVLRENYAGLLSRRIDSKNRLVYDITNNEIRILNCRYHYR